MAAHAAVESHLLDHVPSDSNTCSYALRALLLQATASTVPTRQVLAKALLENRDEDLHEAADRYAGTSQLGLGLLALAASGDRSDELWSLGPRPPTSVVPTAGLAEAVFAAAPHRPTLLLLDRSRRGKWLENIVGALIGLFVGLEVQGLGTVGQAVDHHPLVVFILLSLSNLAWLTTRQAGRRREAVAGPIVSAVFGCVVLLAAGSVGVYSGLLGAGLLVASLAVLTMLRPRSRTWTWASRLPAWSVSLALPLAVSRVLGATASEVVIATVYACVGLRTLWKVILATRARRGRVKAWTSIVASTAVAGITGWMLDAASGRRYLGDLCTTMLLVLIIDMVNLATDESGWARRLGG